MDRAPLDADRLRAALHERWPRIEVVEQTASTNADLVAAASAGAPERSVLVADHQAAGRGRLDRTWISPPRAGLTVSLLLRPAVPATRLGWLPLLAGLALREAVRSAAGVATSLKWPNDLLAADSRKLAGILAQTAGDAVVVGIGLNVSATAAELPVLTASSLALAGATNLDRTALLIELLETFDEHYRGWTTAGDHAGAIRTAYLAASSTVGSQVEVALGADVLVGEAVDVDEVGRLVVRTADGDERAVSAGDVRHVRRASGAR